MHAIFDLYGTLVRSQDSPTLPQDWSHSITTLLNVDPQDFTTHFATSTTAREQGKIGFQAAVQDATRKAGGHPGKEQTNAFTRHCTQQLARHLNDTLRPGALDTLRSMRARGYRLSLLSNASADTALALRPWVAAPLFDTIAVSASIRARKPHPAAYASVLAKPGDIYIGDGGSQELAGASSLGLIALQVPELHWDGTETFRNVGNEEQRTPFTELLTRIPAAT